jgi:hypothetical protein
MKRHTKELELKKLEQRVSKLKEEIHDYSISINNVIKSNDQTSDDRGGFNRIEL